MKQVAKPKKWQSGLGWSFAFLEMPPEQLSERLGLTFKPLEDDLGPGIEAVVPKTAIGPVVFSRHESSRHSGTDIDVDSCVRRDEALAALSAELGIETGDYAWVSSTRECPNRPKDMPRPAR